MRKLEQKKHGLVQQLLYKKAKFILSNLFELEGGYKNEDYKKFQIDGAYSFVSIICTDRGTVSQPSSDRLAMYPHINDSGQVVWIKISINYTFMME